MAFDPRDTESAHNQWLKYAAEKAAARQAAINNAAKQQRMIEENKARIEEQKNFDKNLQDRLINDPLLARNYRLAEAEFQSKYGNDASKYFGTDMQYKNYLLNQAIKGYSDDKMRRNDEREQWERSLHEKQASVPLEVAKTQLEGNRYAHDKDAELKKYGFDKESDWRTKGIEAESDWRKYGFDKEAEWRKQAYDSALQTAAAKNSGKSLIEMALESYSNIAKGDAMFSKKVPFGDWYRQIESLYVGRPTAGVGIAGGQQKEGLASQTEIPGNNLYSPNNSLNSTNMTTPQTNLQNSSMATVLSKTPYSMTTIQTDSQRPRLSNLDKVVNYFQSLENPQNFASPTPELNDNFSLASEQTPPIQKRRGRVIPNLLSNKPTGLDQYDAYRYFNR